MTSSDILRVLQEEESKFKKAPKLTPVPVLNKVTNKREVELQETPSSSMFSVQELEQRMISKLVEEFKRSRSYSRPYYSVTEIIYCLRKAYFSRLKYKIEPDEMFSFPYLYLINQVGNIVHKVIQDLYSLTDCEKTIISDSYKVKGRIDGLLNPQCLVEIKTIDHDKIAQETPSSHIDQCQIYSYILNEDYGGSIDSFNLIYVSRTLKKVVVRPYRYDKEKVIPLLERAKVLDVALKNTTIIPERYCCFDECYFCQYKKYCDVQVVSSNQIHDFQTYSEPIVLL